MKKSKRIVSLLLVMCMLGGIIFGNIGNIGLVQAETTEGTHLTFQDFGIADHATENAYGSTYGWSSWEDMEALLENGGSIKEHITVTAMDDEVVLANNGILFFSNMNDWDGIKLRFDVPNDRLYFEITSSLRNGEAMPGDNAFAITPADVNRTESFYSSSKGFELKLTFEPSGENGEDLLVSVYVDGVQFVGNDADVVNGVITIPNAVTVIKASKGNTNSERNSVWCQLPDVNLDLVAERGEGEGEITSSGDLTFKDFGIADHATENAYGSTYGWSSWEDMEALLENGGSISEHITFTAMDDEVVLSNNGILFFSNMNAWDGIKMMFDTANEQLYCQVVSLTDGESMSGDNTFAIKPADVGRTESFFSSTGFELKLAFTPAANGEDLMLSIYIDGVQYMGNADADVVNGVITIPNAISVIKASKGQTNWERNSIWCMLPDVDLDLVAPGSENEEEITSPGDLTFKDFGISDHATENAYGSTYGWSSWEDMETLLKNGGSIREHITVTAMDDEVVLSNNGILFFSNMNAWDGIKMMFDTANDRLYCQVVSLTDGESMSGDNTFAIKPADVGRTESFFNSTGFELKLAFTPAANGKDLMLSIYIDGVQYMGNADADVVNGVITIPNAISVIKASKGQTGWERNSIWCMLPDVDLDLVAPKLAEYTFKDFGLANQTYTTSTGNNFKKNINNLLNGGTLIERLSVARGTANYFLVLFAANAGDWSGIQMQFQSNGTIFMYFGDDLRDGVAMAAGGDNAITITRPKGSFLNSQFEIRFDFDIAENGKDLVMNLYIDGVRFVTNDVDCPNGIATIPNAVTSITEGSQYLNLIANGGGDITVYGVNDEEKIELAEDGELASFRKLSLSDFGLGQDFYQKQTYSALSTTESLLNTVLSLDITWKGTTNEVSEEGDVKNPWICYGGIEKGSNAYRGGISFRMNETALEVVGTDKLEGAFEAFEIPVSAIGKDTFYNNAFNLSISFEKIDSDEDRSADDVEVGIYINGELYNDTYIYLVNGVRTLGTTLGILPDPAHETGNAILQIKNYQHAPSQFDVLSLEDFGVNPGIYTSNNNNFSVNSEGSYAGTLNDKIFITNIKFGSADSQLVYGGLYIGTERSVGFTPHWTEFKTSKFGRIEAHGTGVQLANNTYELGISGRNVDSDGDGSYDDYEIGIWFDGRLYNDSYYYLPNAKDFLKPTLAVYCADRAVSDYPNRGAIDGDGYVALGDVVQNTATEVVYCADEFAYFVDGDSITINDTTYTKSQSLLVPGIYDITRTERDSIYKDLVTIYKTNDVSEDGSFDIRDVVALKKVQSDARTFDVPAKLAINMASDTLPEAAYDNMITSLLASGDEIGAKVISDSIVGAMGPEEALTGSYITDVERTKEGSSVISISDTKDSTWSSDEGALNGSGLDFVLDFDTDRELKVLQISDTQVADSTYNYNNKLTAATIELYKPQYRGLMLYDELDELIARTKPDLILLAGDVIFGEFDLDGYALQELADHMDSYRIPWAPLMGNHEQEVAIKTAGICEIYENSKYCLFTRRNEIGGNGNYAIGLAKRGQMERVIYMMDSNGCWNVNAEDKAAYADGTLIGAVEFIVFDDQIAWYRTVAARVNQLAKKEIPSSMCIHVGPAEVHYALKQIGYSNSSSFDWGMDDTTGNFGFKGESSGGLKDFIGNYLKASGTDSMFMGHSHMNSCSVVSEGIRYTFGLKTGRYDSNPLTTGGTLITVDNGDFTVEHVVITELATADPIVGQ